MSEDEDQKGRGKNSWLSEHDSIQSELIKMKEELIKEKVDKKDAIIDDPKEAAPVSQNIRKEPTVPQTDIKPDSTISTPPISGEMTIKQMLAREQESVIQKKEEKTEEGEHKPPKRLEEGKIPVAPGLSSKIANVIQLENNLKRRKFEMEKKQREAKLPPPPKKPTNKEESKITQKEVLEKSDKSPIKESGSFDRAENGAKGPQEQRTPMVRRVMKRFIRKPPAEKTDPGIEKEGDPGLSPNNSSVDMKEKEVEGRQEGDEKKPAKDIQIENEDVESKPRKKDPLEKLRGLLGEK